MAHSLTQLPAPNPPPPISKTHRKNTHFPSLGFQRVWACHQDPSQAMDTRVVNRRTVGLGLASAVLGLNINNNQNANAAARRPPPPPPKEKKDPSVSGVQAKILASKKRKEAMKEEVTKLRERGKPVD